MKIQDAVVLVTGGNRGIGKALVAEALARGARKVYATARDPKTVTNPDAVPLALEVTDPGSVAAVAARAGDVNILINNAGVYLGGSLLTGDFEQARREFEVNFFGPLQLIRAFAPIISGNGGGHIQNVNSALGFVTLPGFGAYSATKAALWMATNALRLELPAQGVELSSLHLGWTDTDMAAHRPEEKLAPAEVARKAADGIEAGAAEIIVDEITQQAKGAVAIDPALVYGRPAA